MTDGLKPLHLCTIILQNKIMVKMKAATAEKYGSPEVLKVKTIKKPVPQSGEILIKIHATAVNSGDVRLRKADPFAVRFFFGLFKPSKKILGGVFSGEVEALGAGVQQYKIGDQVFGATQLRFGTYAEYICLPEAGALALKPDQCSHAAAAALPFGGITAYHFLQQAKIQPGQKVLVYGASGAVGSTAVQIAKYFGAEVTAVCGTANAEMVRSIGADKVLDYTQTDFSKTGEQYDVVMETVNKAPVAACFAAAKKGGTVILSAVMPSHMLGAAITAAMSGKKIIMGVAQETPEAVLFLQKLAKAGQISAPIDREYPLDQIAEAHRYVENGHKKGNVVVRVGGF